MLEMITMRRCRQVARVLQDYLDGEADARTAAKVHDHLEVCRRCGLEAATYRAIKTAIPAALAEQNPAAVDPAVLDRLRQFTDRLGASDDSEQD